MQTQVHDETGPGAKWSAPKSGVRHNVATLAPPVQWGLYRATLIANDVLMAGLAFAAATLTRIYVPLPIFNLEADPTVPSITIILFGFVPLWVTIFALQGLYNRRNLLGGLQEYAGVFRATTIGMLLIIIIGFLQPVITPARGWVLLAWVFAALFVGGGRFVLRRIVYGLRRRGYFLSPALIVGINGEAQSLAAQLSGWRTSGLSVIGYVGNDGALTPDSGDPLPVLGKLDQLDQIVRATGATELILASSALSREETLEVFKQFGLQQGMNLRLSTGLYEVITTGLEVKETASVPLLQVNQVQLTGFDWMLKTALDYSLSLLLMIVVLPLLVIIAIAIKLDSPGPVLYRRRVLGLGASEFDAFKFRTMVTNGDEVLAAAPDAQALLDADHKLKDDPRVTRVGNWLRRSSLDELPQLLNVLRHEMSLVGPRMISPAELSKYDQWDMNLLTVLPGITGLWQVSGRSDLSYGQRVNLDMQYIRNWSIWLDLQLLFQTVPAVIRGDGAY